MNKVVNKTPKVNLLLCNNGCCVFKTIDYTSNFMYKTGKKSKCGCLVYYIKPDINTSSNLNNLQNSDDDTSSGEDIGNEYIKNEYIKPPLLEDNFTIEREYKKERKKSKIKIRFAAKPLKNTPISLENIYILLVQSRGMLWGPPKGTKMGSESDMDCAIREVNEETGLDITYDMLTNGSRINRAVYYYVQVDEIDKYIDIQSHDDDEKNDANGIGWINLKCLQEMLMAGRIRITQHCKFLLINKFKCKFHCK